MPLRIVRTGQLMKSQEVRIVVPEPHFTLFNAMRDELPEIIVVNDALLTFEHTDIFPWYLNITIDAHDLAENGLPTEDESRLLFEIGDVIEDAILGGRTEHDGKNALFLARSTWNGMRELRYQVHDPEIADKALRLLLDDREWERPWGYEMKGDETWESAGIVFQLFPMANGCDA
jgi:hypothetical protein